MTTAPPRRRLLGSFTGAQARVGQAAIGAVVLNLGGTAFRLGVQAALSRWLGPTGYGRFVVMRGWGGLIARLPNRGYHLAMVRWLPGYAEQGRGHEYRRLVHKGMSTTLTGSLVLTVVAMAFAAVVLDDTSSETMVGLTLIVGVAAMQLYRHVFQASFRHVVGVTSTELVYPAVFAVLALASGLAFGRSVTGALGALALAAVVVAVGQAVVVERTMPPDGAVDTGADEDAWRRGTRPLFIGQLGIAALEVQYLLIVGAVLGPKEAGIFAVAQRVALLGRMGNSAVESVIGPQFSRLAADDPTSTGRMQGVVDRGIRLSSALTLVACLGLVVVSDIALGLFGSEFTEGRTLLWVLLIGNVVNALTGPTGYLVSMTGSEVIYGYVMVGHAAAGAVLALLIGWRADSAIAIALVATAVTISWNVWLIRIGGRRLGVWCVPRPLRRLLGLGQPA